MKTFLRYVLVIAKTSFGISLVFSFFVSAASTCPCSYATSFCQCMQLERLFLLDRKTHGAPVESVDWLCTNTTSYAAIGGYFDQATNRDIRIYKFLETGYLDEVNIGATSHGNNANDIVFSVAWCEIPNNGIYLAIGGYPSTVDEQGVRVYKFNPGNPVATTLVEIVAFRHYNKVRSVSWLCQECEGQDASIRYLAIGGDRSERDGYDVRILKFDPEGETLEPVSSRFHNASGVVSDLGDVFSVDWVTCSNNIPLLAIGGRRPSNEDVTIRVYSFDCEQEFLQSLTNKGGTGSEIREVRWCCDSSGDLYLAAGGTHVGGVVTNSNIFLYKLNRSTCTLNNVATANPLGLGFSIDFIPSCNCTHFTTGIGCVSSMVSDPNIIVYKQTSSSALNKITSKKYGENVNAVRWCKKGDCNYLLVGTGIEGWSAADVCGDQRTEFEIALYQAVFCLPQIDPPVVICAQRTCRRSPTQANIVNIFTWKPVANAVKYEIYADENMTSLITTVFANQNLVFCQYCINPCARITYYITAVDASNNKSTLVKVTI